MLDTFLLVLLLPFCGNIYALQLANSSMDYDPLYDADKGFKVMPSSFHDIGDVEFQDNWCRVWYESFDFITLIICHVL